MTNPDNKELLDSLIVGRVKPHIYAFTTNTIPNYLKVGDTYRPVITRLREWMKHFPNLQKEYENTATINDDVFFRDYSVHQYLEVDMGKHRLEPDEYPGIYYSNEFFEDVSIDLVDTAINDIHDNYAQNTGKYKYYDANSRLPETFTYASTGEWELRPNQQETVDRFVAAVDSGRTNLLMYAVMRFGKSFTSLCCAKAKGYKVVLVVSAKADVREEWKKTVQSADNFKEYIFVSSEELLQDENAITSRLADGKGVVIFLTLQDLQGDEIKEKHKSVFDNQIDLLIVDETHYGARAESYGKILRSTSYVKDTKDKHADDDFVEIAEAEEQLKSLTVKVTLHLSGTPYRILMGSEFAKEDIIAFYQFSDIVKDQEAWDEDHLLDDSEDIKEWDNPYFGFPQMIRFAFVPNKSALSLLDSLKKSGVTYAFSALLKPQSIKKDTEKSLHKKFEHETEVLELFEAIDGSKEDDGLLAFLDYDKIKDGKMCQHIVCVLPYCASCDALETLIEDNLDRFKNLQDYTIINISGVDSPNEYRNVQSVKSKIRQCAAEGKKTLTLTVNRMLTGSTVEEWDTMIFLKDTASPQEYDQAIFRLQNQYIKEYLGTDGDKIKYNMKPQTLLVDFDPHRMFVMQEQKSQIYNANTDAAGNEHLRDRLEDELRISPIVTLNKNRIERVQAANILAEISEYSNSRGVLDESKDIPVDMSLLDINAIRETIERQAELGSRQGLSVVAHTGTEGDLDLPNGNDNETDDGEGAGDNSGSSDPEQGPWDNPDDEDNIKSLENKFRTYYSRILFFAFLTKSSVASLEDIIRCIDSGENPRMANNLNLNKDILVQMKDNMNIFILRQLDYKIQNMNMLAHDGSVEPMQRAAVAIKKFGRISDSEITTPEKVADDMISLLPDECFSDLQNSDSRLLDIASKMGEFAVSIVKRCNEIGISVADIKCKVLSICTSSVAYEFTRKVYEILGLDIECIAEQFNSYDMLNVKTVDENGSETDDVDYTKICGILSQKKEMCSITLDDEYAVIEEADRMKFNAVVGNPPYQESDGGAQASARPIYNQFVKLAQRINPLYVSMVIPARWYAGGRGLDEFRNEMLSESHIRELHDYPFTGDCFSNVNIRGGICYFLLDSIYDNRNEKVKVVTHEGETQNAVYRDLKYENSDIFIRQYQAISILNKVRGSEAEFIDAWVSSLRPFGLRGYFSKDKEFRASSIGMNEPIKCYAKGKMVGYVEKALIPKNHEQIDVWKVFMPRANNIGTELKDDNINPYVGEKGTICTESLLMLTSEGIYDENTAENLCCYLKTKFARFMHSLAKSSQDATSKTFRYVPAQDFTVRWSDRDLYTKYGLTQEEIDLIENSIKPMA